uniref:Uncharacterized protein n=1 Tax=Anguilla anguilla TaxID=7936 RepID=A0A0E9V0T6_ANGAN
MAQDQQRSLLQHLIQPHTRH